MISNRMNLIGEVDGTFDFYAVNGLQGSTALDLSGFYQSRDYVDNNSDPAAGGRVTFGSSHLRAGASLTTGQFNNEGDFGADAEHLDYKIYGTDLTYRCGKRFRLNAEYARRTSDVFSFSSGVDREDIRGVVLEGEYFFCCHPGISAVARYDEQRRAHGPPISGSAIATGEFSVQRFTWGFNFTIAGGTTLIINHEHWQLPERLPNPDVLAIRWFGAF